MKREEKKAATRQKLIDAACDLMLTNGVQKTGVKQVSEHAGISMVTLYKYFETKEQLTEAVVLKFFDQSVSLSQQVIANDDLPFLDKFFVYTRDEALAKSGIKPEIMEEFASVVRKSPNIEQHIREFYRKFWQKLIDYGRQKGEITTNASDSVIQMQFSMLGDFITSAGPDAFSDDTIRQLESLLMYGLSGEKNA
ncbi:TetR/AcrR family transcriptional regulator [Lacticaseibacillus pantheris]